MDRIIRNTLGLFMIIFFIFASVATYNGFVESAYRDSLNSTYVYSCTITTTSTLSNVTFFIPVPADPSGNSPVVARFSDQDITGLPGDWTATLYDTGKATLVKITVPAIRPPGSARQDTPYSVTLSSQILAETMIDTLDPVNNSALFRPVQDFLQVSCPPGSSPEQRTPAPQCYQYHTSLYADYQAPPDASVNITAVITGNNSWKIFDAGFSEYHSRVTVVMSGANHGWSVMQGELEQGIGIYHLPAIPEKPIE
ncbi:MAG: hypothetical protein LUQ04_05725 [Methanoregula sp.]|nr:hypothetical protein [Methanoregula sp.]